MSLKKVIREFYHEKKLQEGFDPEGNPDLKYYAFDWDDNIVHMPTKIILKTEEFEMKIDFLEIDKANIDMNWAIENNKIN